MGFAAGYGKTNVDLLFENMPRLPEEGEEIFTDRFSLCIGGGVPGTMITLGRLGIECKTVTELSDDMFSYFLVFGKNEKLSESIYAQSSDFIEHMIAEHTILLEEQGYRIEREERIPEALVKADQVYFGRVIGNIFSNIAKYADILSPVTISSRIEKEYLVISFANMVASGDRHAESNGIGLKTCARIMEQMNGRFESSLVGDSFTATVYISVKS